MAVAAAAMPSVMLRGMAGVIVGMMPRAGAGVEPMVAGQELCAEAGTAIEISAAAKRYSLTMRNLSGLALPECNARAAVLFLRGRDSGHLVLWRSFVTVRVPGRDRPDDWG